MFNTIRDTTINWIAHVACDLNIISKSLSISIASVSSYLTDLSHSPSVSLCVCVSVCRVVCLSGKCTVAKRLIG